jgi:hypothetical protein
LSCLPRSEPDCTSLLNRSPVDRWVKPYFATILSHCVPLPDPGPPVCVKRQRKYQLILIPHRERRGYRQGCTKTKTKLHGLSPRANYTDRATAACRRSDC